MLKAQPRIVVVGTSGSGKTTLARSLARILDRTHIELDALHWGPNWTPRPEFAELVQAAVSADTWLVDGNYGKVRDLIWRRATAIVWLNYPFHLVFGRALLRTCRRIISQEPMYSENRESFRQSFFDKDGIPWWVIRTHARRRRELRSLLEDARYRHLDLTELRTHAQALELVRRERASSSPDT